MIEQYEDSHDIPLWLNYQLRFQINGNRKIPEIKDKIKKFEKEHPELQLVHAEHGIKEIKLHEKEPLFQDNENAYFNVKYSYFRHTYTFYYQPSEDLHSFLSNLQDFIIKIKLLRNKYLLTL